MDTYDAQEREILALTAFHRFLDGGFEGGRDQLLAEHPDLRELLLQLLADNEQAAERIGDFELVREVGRGGMGIVYEAIQQPLGRRIALKRLIFPGSDGPAATRFEREAKLAAGLEHPGIATVHEFRVIGDESVLVMDFIDGMPLDQLLARGSSTAILRAPTPAQELVARLEAHSKPAQPESTATHRTAQATCARLALEIASALGHAHDAGVVHRDVKPGNVLVTRSGHAVLTDFGLARALTDAGALTRSGDFAGTPHYAAPEQLLGEHTNIAPQTDVFALGVTLFEMLAGQRPYGGNSVATILRSIESHEPTQIRRLAPGVDRDLAAIVHRAIEARAEDRYTDGNAMAADLRRYLEGHPVEARPVPLHGRVRRWIGRNKIATGLLVTLVSGATASGVLGWQAATEAHAKSVVLRKYQHLMVSAELDALPERIEQLVQRPSSLLPKQPNPEALWTQYRAELRTLLGTTRRLVDRLPEQRSAMTALVGGRQLPAGLRDARGDHPATRRIEAIDAEILRYQADLAREHDPSAGVSQSAAARARRWIDALQAERRALEQDVDAWRRVRLADTEERFLHDQLARQIHALGQLRDRSLTELLARSTAADEAEAALRSHQELWDAAAARVASAGVRLPPQHGLVPLGPDPQSGLEEFGHLASGQVPSRGADGALVLARDSGLVFVLIPPGSAEAATHKIELDPFFVAKFETSRRQWQKLANETPGLRLQDGGILDIRNLDQLDKPANGVSWTMAAKLALRHGLGLPTEAQWNALSDRAFDGWQQGEAYVAARLNLRDQSYRVARNSSDPCAGFTDGFVGLAPIHSMQPDAVGLHHLFGNVSEWCQDAFKHQSPGLRGGDGATASPVDFRVVRVYRGGAWNEVQPQRSDRAQARFANRAIGCRFTRHLDAHATR